MTKKTTLNQNEVLITKSGVSVVKYNKILVKKELLKLRFKMNKQDLEAFDKWWDEERGGKPLDKDHIPVTEEQLYKWESQSWQAALEYERERSKILVEALNKSLKGIERLNKECSNGYDYFDDRVEEDVLTINKALAKYKGEA